MKRTKKVEKDTGKVWFVKTGRGSFRFRGKIIKPNQKFLAYPGDIPPSFMDVVIPLDKKAAKLVRPKVGPVEYKLEPRGGNWFNIVNAKTGKRMNEKGLRRVEALKLVEKLAG